MKKIAITGGIGSGKSTLLNYLKECGYSVLSCDEIYKDVIQSSEYIKQIAELFPNVITQNKIDRVKLSELVFNNEEKRKLLNSVAHPLIMKNLFEQMGKFEKDFVFAEVPLLFEGAYEDLFDGVIVLKRNINNRIEALKLRDGIYSENAKKRIAAQFDYDVKGNENRLKKGHIYIIENDGSINDLIKSLNELLKTL